MSEMLNITVGKLLEQVANTYPDRQAVKYTDRDYDRTWREFDEEAKRFAKGLLSIGIKKGDHVAIWATNVPEWLLTLFATAKIGAVLVTVNTNYKVFELEYLLRQSDTKALVMINNFKATNYVDIINELCPTLKDSKPNEYNDPKLPFLKSVIYCGEKSDRQCPAGMMPWEDLYARADSVADSDFYDIYNSLDAHDVINMQYTSGTTGFPKGVMLTHYNILNNGRCIGDNMKFTHEDKLCIVVPFFHCFGLVLAILACLTHASSMVPVAAFHPVTVMDALQNEKCTAFHGVPTMYISMLEHADFKNYKFPHLRTGLMSGSPCPITVMQQVIDEMNMSEITIAYGMTESSPVSTMTSTDDSIEHRVSTVGRVMPGVEIKITDPETGKEVGYNQPGEFCVRGYSVMKGYYKMEEATRQAVDEDGWLHSGDLVSVDEDGYYKVTGRIKDMIIRGGENIYPKEIEEFLYTHPKISDVQVIGVPSKRYGEEIMACIILKDGETLAEDEVKDFVRANMARHKIPSYIAFIDSFPMTASGKIQKFLMREWAVEHFNLSDASNIETA